MDKDQLIKQLMPTFIAEMEEHLITFSTSLEALSKSPTEKEKAEILKLLMRTAHSLKGASRSVNLTTIEQTCHAMEDIFSLHRSGIAFDADDFANLFSTIQLMTKVVGYLKDEREHPEAPLETINEGLKGQLEMLQQRKPAEAESAVDASPKVPAITLQLPIVAPQPVPPSSPDPSSSSTAATTGNLPLSPDASAEALEQQAKALVRIPKEKLDSLLSATGELIADNQRFEGKINVTVELQENLQRQNNSFIQIKRQSNTLKRRDKHRLQLDRAETAENAQVFRSLESWQTLNQTLLDFCANILKENLEQLENLGSQLNAERQVFSQALKVLSEEVVALRMTPFGEACSGLQKALEDLAQSTNKEVSLVITGEDVGVDRDVVERLKVALLQLVRNALDHGIETPDERQARGKNRSGLIQVSAEPLGSSVQITVRDDGNGIDRRKLLAKAHKLGLIAESDEFAPISVIFEEGFTTADKVSAVSGRGVGLDIVKEIVESLRGNIEVTSNDGGGTLFTLTLPTTLLLTRVLIFSVADNLYAVPTASVHRVSNIDATLIVNQEHQETATVDGAPFKVVSFRTLFNLPKSPGHLTQARETAIIISADGNSIALLVDKLIGEQEVVVKSSNARMSNMRNFSGTTMVYGGSLALVLNASEFVRHAIHGSETSNNASTGPKARKPGVFTILVADDSVTTRSMQRNMLESAGYEIVVATDGVNALEQLKSAPVDMIISDVQMPRMDGYELCKAVRASRSWRTLPFVLITSLASQQDKDEGIACGADAFIVKKEFEHTKLLDLIKQLSNRDQPSTESRKA